MVWGLTRDGLDEQREMNPSNRRSHLAGGRSDLVDQLQGNWITGLRCSQQPRHDVLVRLVEQLGEAKLIGFGKLVVAAIEKSFKHDIELAHPAPATPSQPVDGGHERYVIPAMDRQEPIRRDASFWR